MIKKNIIFYFVKIKFIMFDHKLQDLVSFLFTGKSYTWWTRFGGLITL